ncbi:IclR family transcriptional regulator domain-containing protein [Advenella kashmirensis]
MKAIEQDDINDNETNSQTFIRSLARGLSVLEVFGNRMDGLSSSEIAGAAGLDRATTRRILLTLQKAKYIRQIDDRYYLTAQILNFGYGYLSSLPFWELARPIMQELVAEIHESSSAAVLESGEVVYVARVRSNSRMVDVARTVGSRVPAYCTSLGHVLLAGLPEQERNDVLSEITFKKYTENTITNKKQLSKALDNVAQQGWAISEQQLEIGLCSIAVPLHDSKGKVIAALNVSVQTPRVSTDTLINKLLPALKLTAAEIDRAARARAE